MILSPKMPASSENIEKVPPLFPKVMWQGGERESALIQKFYQTHDYYLFNLYATLWDAWLPEIALSMYERKNGEEVLGKKTKWLLDIRDIDQSGYVSTMQHRGLGHPLGWPFPLFTQIEGPGWVFGAPGLPYVGGHNIELIENLNGWELKGVEMGEPTENSGRKFNLTQANAEMTTPFISSSRNAAPNFRLDLKQMDPTMKIRPYLQLKTKKKMNFESFKKVYFELAKRNPECDYYWAQVHPFVDEGDLITGIKLGFENNTPGSIDLQVFASAVDTRHPLNNASYLKGISDYYLWTGDVNFLSKNIEKARKALEYMVTEFDLKSGIGKIPWFGHNGKSGLRVQGGHVEMIPGMGIGSNYFDLLPCGGDDFYTTIYGYFALKKWADIEEMIEKNAALSIPSAKADYSSSSLRKIADNLRKKGSERFWDPKVGRFVTSIDVDGVAHDYGFTTLNLEAIHYGFADKEKSASILSWIDGARKIEGDTSQGSDIYHWRMGPRVTTKRNVDWYTCVWNAPSSIPWGDQIQDGGSVIGFSYFDLMARLKNLGSENAKKRVLEILSWFEETQNEGGYRAYYSKPDRGTLQGGGPPGGLGVDNEFYESLLLPQVFLQGFFGFEPKTDGFALDPKIPSDWKNYEVSAFSWKGGLMRIKAIDARHWEIERLSGDPLKTLLYLKENLKGTVLTKGGDKKESRNEFKITADHPALLIVLEIGKPVEIQID